MVRAAHNCAMDSPHGWCFEERLKAVNAARFKIRKGWPQWRVEQYVREYMGMDPRTASIMYRHALNNTLWRPGESRPNPSMVRRKAPE